MQTQQAEGFFDLGTRHLQQGDDDQAISAYNKAIEISPKYAEAYLNRGIAYRRKGQHDQAISDYSAVLLIDSKDAQPIVTGETPISKKVNMTRPSPITIKLLR